MRGGLMLFKSEHVTHLSAPPGTPSLHHMQVSSLPAATGAGTQSPLQEQRQRAAQQVALIYTHNIYLSYYLQSRRSQYINNVLFMQIKLRNNTQSSISTILLFQISLKSEFQSHDYHQFYGGTFLLSKHSICMS